MQINEIILLLQKYKYFYSLSILIAFYILSELIVFISQKIILRLTKKTKTDIDDIIVKRTSKPISIILILVGIRLALFPLKLSQKSLGIFENMVVSSIIIVVTYITIVVIDVLIDNWGKNLAAKTESRIDDEIIPVLHRLSRIFISIIGLLFILPIWGIQIGPLLTSLGIAGIAVAFALQNTLGNIFGGMSILLDKSIKVGDKIKLDADTMGTVVDVGLRSTKIRSWDNEMITIPNGKLADAKILNFFQPDPSVRITIDFGVEYGSNPDKVRKVVTSTIKKLPNLTRVSEIKVVMMEMADFALKFKVLFWVKNFDVKFDTKALATERIYLELNKAKIVIPFPTRTVYLKK